MQRFFWKKKEKKQPESMVQTAERSVLPALWESAAAGPAERRVYDSLRQNIPLIDAALDKIVRLIGEFKVSCPDAQAEQVLASFLENVQVNSAQNGVQSFLNSYLTQLLMYGNAVGEAVLAPGGSFAALYNASLEEVELREASPLQLEVRRRELSGSVPVKYPELVFASALNPPPGSAKGVSILKSLPFVSGVLLQIYQSVGLNWERVGNVRFAVTYQPGNDAADRAFAKERAGQIATEWTRAMNKGTVSDFVAVGNVNIKAIGADSPIPDCNVPVRVMLEQIVAKLGLPPFLLGLSWSSTERMSSQQADILTSELEAYRRLLNPVIYKIVSLWMRVNGYTVPFKIEWDDITLQDELDLADARLKRAQAMQIEAELEQRGN